MTLAKHLACLECGYDLHGIPEVRCPECGFHYDAKALVWAATFDEAARLAPARILIARATVAAALAVPGGCLSAGFGGWGAAFLLMACFLGAFITWVAYTDRYEGIKSIPLLSIIFSWAAVFYCLGLIIFPLGLLICGPFVLGTACVIRLRHCPAPPGKPCSWIQDSKQLWRFGRNISWATAHVAAVLHRGRFQRHCAPWRSVKFRDEYSSEI